MLFQVLLNSVNFSFAPFSKSAGNTLENPDSSFLILGYECFQQISLSSENSNSGKFINYTMPCCVELALLKQTIIFTVKSHWD